MIHFTLQYIQYIQYSHRGFNSATLVFTGSAWWGDPMTTPHPLSLLKVGYREAGSSIQTEGGKGGGSPHRVQ